MKKKYAFISCYFNPCNYVSKYFNFLNFVNGIDDSPEYDLYLIESYNEKSKYRIKNNFKECHEVYCKDTYWQKEQLLNILINKYKNDYDFIGWLDGDIMFDNKNWFSNIKEASKQHDFFQIFKNVKKETNFKGKYITKQSTMSVINENKTNMSDGEPGYGYVYNTNLISDIEFPLYQNAILGTGDFLNMSAHTIKQEFNHFATDLRIFQNNNQFLNDFLFWESVINKSKNPGYANNTLKIFYHGSLENRKYITRESVLRENKYNPSIHLEKTKTQMYDVKHDKLKNSIENYFKLRKEDDFFANAFHLTYFKKRVVTLINAFDPNFNMKSEPFIFLNKIKKQLNKKTPKKKGEIKIISTDPNKKDNGSNIIEYHKNKERNLAMFALNYIVKSYDELDEHICFLHSDINETELRKCLSDHIANKSKATHISTTNKDIKFTKNFHILTETKIKRSNLNFMKWYFLNFKSNPFVEQIVNDSMKIIDKSKNVYTKYVNSYCISSKAIKTRDKKFYQSLYNKCKENAEESIFLNLVFPYIFR